MLIGLGASAISRFPQGYAQNAPGTSAYVKAVREGRFSTVRGHAFAGEDLMRARIIESLMCDFRVDAAEITRDFGMSKAALDDLFSRVSNEFGDMIRLDATGLSIPVEARPLTRMIARSFDAYDLAKAGHSHAV